MSGILEALDAMYEVKGDAEADYTYRNRISSKSNAEIGHMPGGKHAGKQKRKNFHSPYSPDTYTADLHREPMRTAKDYERRKIKASHDNITYGYRDEEDKKKDFNRAVRRYNAHTECTETIDTLDGIL